MRPNSKLMRNNHGSTLVMVILCIFFISILGASMLSITMVNRNMKTVDTKAKGNFYDAEMALDELSIALEEIAENTLKETYSNMLLTYSVTPESERTSKFKKEFAKKLFLNLTELPENTVENSLTVTTANQDILLKYILKDKFATGLVLKNTMASPCIIKLKLADYSVVIENLSMEYTDENGYRTTISTDLKITTPYPNLTTTYEDNRGVFYRDYAIIADGTVTGYGGSSSDVNGNIYGGTAIVANGENSNSNKLNIYADKVISRGLLEAKNKGALKISGSAGSDVWVQNIETNGEGLGSNYSIDINGNCYVADDLTLNADGGKVKIAGTYYGYHTNNSSGLNINGTPSGSSSIAVNARRAQLDMSATTKLFIAGKSYLSIPTIYGSSQGDADLSASILQGEAITFKGNQLAYLIPSESIIGIGHNPMTLSEFNALKNDTSGTYYIDLSKNSKGIRFDSYVNPTKIYNEAYVRYFNGTEVETMVYLYLNFQNSNKASEYFKEYYSKSAQALENTANTLQIGDILINREAAQSAGNILSFNTLNETGNKISLTEGEYDFNDTELEATETDLEVKYEGLISRLDESYSASNVPLSLTSNLIRFEDDTINGVDGIKGSNINYKVRNGANSIWIADQDITLSAGDITGGVIISSGDVTLTGVTFTGLIIARGDVILNNANVIANPEVEDLLTSDEVARKYVIDYVERSESTDNASKEKDTILITYENWRKN